MGSLEPSETDLVLALDGIVLSALLSVLSEKPTGLVGGLDMLVFDFMCLRELGIVVVGGAGGAGSFDRCRSIFLEGDFLMGEDVSRTLNFTGERFSWLIFSGDLKAASSLAGEMFSLVGEPSCVCASSSFRPKMLIFRRFAADETTSLVLAPSRFDSGVFASS